MADEKKQEVFTVVTLSLNEEQMSHLKQCFYAEPDEVQQYIEKLSKIQKKDNLETYSFYLFDIKLADTFKPAYNRLMATYREMYKVAIARGTKKEDALQMFGLTEAELEEPKVGASRGTAKRLADLAKFEKLIVK